MPPPRLTISIQNLNKTFDRQLIFKDLSFQIHTPQVLIITGTNGAGKSTLIKTIAGKLKPDSGNIHFILGKKQVLNSAFFHFLAWDMPYLEQYPYFSVKQTFQAHFQFKKPLLSFSEWLQKFELQAFKDISLIKLSSGTLQRVKTGLALNSDTSLLLLDEPTANMDAHFASLFLKLLQSFIHNRILVLASNLEREYEPFLQKPYQTYENQQLRLFLIAQS